VGDIIGRKGKGKKEGKGDVRNPDVTNFYLFKK
jgi:hypothetical protein